MGTILRRREIEKDEAILFLLVGSPLGDNIPLTHHKAPGSRLLLPRMREGL